MTETVKNRVLRLLLHLIFLIIPTACMVVPALQQIDTALLFVNTDLYTQSVVTLIAITGAYCCYFFRFRFIVTFPLVLVLVYTYSKGMKLLSGNEFDSYYLTVRYLHLSVLFVAGWLMGYGLARFRYFPLVLAALVLTTGLLAEAGYNKDLHLEDSVRNLFFVILYAFYTYFIRETLENIEQVRARHFFNAGARLAIFILLFFVLFHTSVFFLRSEFKETDRAIGEAREQQEQQKDPDEENMLTKNKQQKFDLNQYSQLKSRFGTSKELLFAAYVDNFFPSHPDIPNPLYFTCYHLTKYDVKHERFIRDPNMPANDLFAPDPSKIPRYFTYTDSSVIANSKGPLFRKVVESEIYLAALSPKTYTAPGTAFSCQPINVDADYKEQYAFAYKTRSYVSELNSAYFIYNASVGGNEAIREFQEARIRELENVRDYRAVDKKFYTYYTNVPNGALFDSIRSLSNRITEGALTPIEKVLKVRDYFTSRDAVGKPLFKYTLYPGAPSDPNIPNASMLSHFLFKNRKGYCTYFAASTLFLLRAAGVPVRMTTGFMTVDRSDKNKGWYFIYGDQAHAWVQVYFPGYGWLDFDTTIGNDDARESPMPDATPPMKPQKAWFATVGKVTALDAASQTATIAIKVLMLGNNELTAKEETSIRLDMKNATITKANFNRKFKDILVGDTVTAVSYNEALRKIKAPQKKETLAAVLARLPNPTAVDEVTIHEVPEKTVTPTQQATAQKPGMPWWMLMLIVLGIVLFIVIMAILFTGRILFRYYNSRAAGAKQPEEKAYWIFRASEFLYCQFGYYRNSQTPLEFAQQVIQPQLGTGYDDFVKVYHKVKYDKIPADEHDLQIMNRYQATYPAIVFGKYTFMQRSLKFMNVVSTIKFFFN